MELFFKWGISFEQSYAIEEKAARQVQYANRTEIEEAILAKYPPEHPQHADTESEMEMQGNIDFENIAVEARKKRIKTDSDFMDT